MESGVTRRGYAIGAASGAPPLVICHLRGPAPPGAGPARADELPSYADRRDLYRKRLIWDRRVRCTHLVN